MNKVLRFTAPVIALALMSIAPAFVRAQNSTTKTNQTQNASATEDWNTPPAGTEQAQQGYRDGIQALQLDTAAKRKINAQSSYLYLHPPVKGAAKDEYRASFTAGYQAAMKHQSQGGE
jgi:hypothetical protein